MTLTTTNSAWPTSALALRQLLEIDNGGKLSCHGLTKKSVRCTIGISKYNSSRISQLLEQIVAHGGFSSSQAALGEVANLIMCQRFHQSEGPIRLSLWERILKPPEVVLVKEIDKEDAPSSEITNQVSSIAPLVAVKEELQPESETPKPKTTSRRRSQYPPSTPTKSTPKPKQTPSNDPQYKHEFEAFAPPRTMQEINKQVKKLLLRALLVTERNHGGYIYIYTFPETYYDAHPYIKIGFAQDVEERMKRWKSQCGYQSKLLGWFPADHYVKIEKLVHGQLWNQRKREKGCPTCNIRHQEWFKVESMTASKNIAMWTTWMRQKPYDDEGKLLDKWRIRIEGLDMNDPNCWELLVKGVFDEDADESELSEEGESFAWSSDGQSGFPEEDALQGSEANESEFPFTDDEYDDKASIRHGKK
ncbi:hypothetical protein F53441_167 [Fusarium austroafricanum]|uniref:Bacteriophage T5 Orf172 DNA-binding domain-containing protein n=1 Tax=Fusarium austroafricanum TaxID=2364996 RepID=A0A8H4P5G0_9HYPO|nr:hypothetical protein F53441_167 [Fusarium austroafricanum]